MSKINYISKYYNKQVVFKRYVKSLNKRCQQEKAPPQLPHPLRLVRDSFSLKFSIELIFFFKSVYWLHIFHENGKPVGGQLRISERKGEREIRTLKISQKSKF